ncbi:hypothetical protein EJ06DRAFT_147232 [Trichodelitschia bisporula]|uniref:Uncharacterized protein n=1 Tax=Trichodelitschia bisporula TaxID=703511 RepID=A0A6G1HNQ1_9PEZI|nr:hypothetical protein EJ06DRAFT_147232 [Trichodelitschia bisporula]
MRVASFLCLDRKRRDESERRQPPQRLHTAYWCSGCGGVQAPIIGYTSTTGKWEPVSCFTNSALSITNTYRTFSSSLAGCCLYGLTSCATPAVCMGSQILFLDGISYATVTCSYPSVCHTVVVHSDLDDLSPRLIYACLTENKAAFRKFPDITNGRPAFHEVPRIGSTSQK